MFALVGKRIKTGCIPFLKLLFLIQVVSGQIQDGNETVCKCNRAILTQGKNNPAYMVYDL